MQPRTLAQPFHYFSVLSFNEQLYLFCSVTGALSCMKIVKCFPSDPNKLILLSSLKWTLEQFSSLLTTHSSAKVRLAFLLMRGLVNAESTFSPTSLKHAETDPYPVHRWTGKQSQLQFWTNSPLTVSTFSCFLLHLSCVSYQSFGGTWISVIVKMQSTQRASNPQGKRASPSTQPLADGWQSQYSSIRLHLILPPAQPQLSLQSIAQMMAVIWNKCQWRRWAQCVLVPWKRLWVRCLCQNLFLFLFSSFIHLCLPPFSKQHVV